MSSSHTTNPIGPDEFLKFAEQAKSDQRARNREHQEEK